MPASNKQSLIKSNPTESHGRASGARKYGKTAGTRVGVMADWRAAGAKVGGEKAAHGKRVRDGR